ncbi:biotin transporter BioY [Marivita hallyeonensis]|uniref:Biotin transporter n=1 Tax=Marivita hallyeonensis TaxID=996342 RepID=A0A1M5RZJ1_9RHOB|nr:biotin transporter BioY [Marivita hallyeonensis]SHH31787.1 biotin transport system substrate-specific component [Marivita hallyeonensis]
MTLTQAAFGKSTLLRQTLLALGGAALIAAATQISVPFFPVPMTLQTLAILVIGLSFGARLGTATLLTYLGYGAIGLPVFANGMNGLAFVGPTAGFLFGFVVMAGLAGLAADRGVAKGFVSTALVTLVLAALLYVPGIAWPMAVASATGVEAGWVGQDMGYYWTYFTAPFLIGDAVKAILAALIVTGAWKALKARQS